MKKLLIIIFCISIYSETLSLTHEFNRFGLFGGIKYVNPSNIGNVLSFNWKIPLSQEVVLFLSLGYKNTSTEDKYSIQTYSRNIIEGEDIYTAIDKNIHKQEYKMFPLSFGIQYYLNKNFVVLPYLILEGGYNFIDPNLISSEKTIAYASSVQELPREYQDYTTVSISNRAAHLAIGSGLELPINSKFSIDLRYFYSVEVDLLNTHELVIGIVF